MAANALRKYEKDEKLIALAKKRNHVPWCDDYEKMISGMQYNAMVKELTDGRHRAKQIIHKYNNHFPEGATAGEMARLREPLLHDLFGSVGKDSWVEAPMWIDFGCNIAVGDRFYANYNLTVLDCALVTIGDRVMFGPNVSIYAATHDVDVRSRQQNLELAFGVTIGDDCWIGGNVTIVSGVNIGKGCTIGAGATVTKDIPDWSVAVGCPARVVRKVDPCGPPPEDEEVNMPQLD